MGEWENKELSPNLCEIVAGSTPPTSDSIYWEGEHVWITPNDLSNLAGYTISDSARKLTLPGVKRATGKLLPANSVVISCRAPVGYCAISLVPFSTNQGCKTLICNGIDEIFLYYVLSKSTNALERVSSGTTFLELPKKELARFKVSYPTEKAEQQKIVEVLTTIDEAIDKTRALIKKYTNVKTGMMQDLLANGIDDKGKIRTKKTHKYKESLLGQIPVEWECVDLFKWSSKQSDSIVDGPFGSNLKLVHYRDSGIPVIQSGFVTSGTFIAKKYVYVEEAKFKEQYRSRANPLDIIIAKIGVQCGRCAVLPKFHPVSIIAGNCIRMTVDSNYNSFLLQEILSYYYDLGYFDLIRSVTAQPAINLTKLKAFKVIFMEKEEQRRIYSAFTFVDNKIQAEREYFTKLQNIKKGLMKDLLTPGRVSVDPLLKKEN